MCEETITCRKCGGDMRVMRKREGELIVGVVDRLYKCDDCHYLLSLPREREKYKI